LRNERIVMLNTFDELAEVAKQAQVNRLDKKIYRREKGINRDKSMLIWYGGTSGVKGFAVKFPIVRRIRRVLNPMGTYAQACARSDALIDDFLTHTDLYRQSFALLSDTWSKQAFVNLLSGNMLLDPRYGDHFSQYKKGAKECYCVDLSAPEEEVVPFFNKGETLVDCGAYTCDTLQEFICEGYPPIKYFGFEPNYENYVKAQKIFKASGIAGDVYNAGVYNANGEMGFQGKGSGGKVILSGETNIKVLSLDETIKEPVTLIKMDIEGSEYQALEGGVSLIRAYKPKLAISMYHKVTDYRTLPLLAKQLNTNYTQFYIRYLSSYFGDRLGFQEVTLFVR